MIIDGKLLAKKILANLSSRITQLPFQPVFCDVLVGNNPVSTQYVKMKAHTAEIIGLKFKKANFPENITTNELINEIVKINLESNLCGLIVQLPLPNTLEKQKVLNAISPTVDVDCIGKKNSELFYSGQGYVKFPTAAAVVAIIESLDLELKYKRFLVIGQGELVGKPTTFLLKQKKFTVDVADKFTKNILDLTRRADIIVSAVGKAGLVNGEDIKPGCVVIDAGTSESNGGIVGDVDLASVLKVASFVSPVPGGVGPVTVAQLLYNVVKVAELKNI